MSFALRCASCSCRAGALYIQSENQPFVSKLPRLISFCLCTAYTNAQIPICKTVALIISKNHACSNLLKTRGRCVLLPLIFSNLLRTTSYGKSYLLIRITGCLTAMVSTISSTNSFMSILINKLGFLPPKFYISYGFLQQLHINWF